MTRLASAVLAALAIAGCASPTDESDAMAKFTQAHALYLHGDYDKSVPLYEEALDKRPLLREAYHELAYAYEVLGRESEAVKTLQRALKNADTKDEHALRQLARLYVHKGYAAEAMQLYVQLHAVAPSDASVELELARLEGLKIPDPKLEQVRMAKARAKFEEIRPTAERYIAERRFEDAIVVINAFPEEYRDTEYWVKTLGPMREQAEKARQK